MLNFIPINLQVHKIFKIMQVLFFRGFSVLWSPKEHINILFTKDMVISVYFKEDKSVHHELGFVQLQCHWKCHHLIDRIRVSIHLP